MREIGYEDCKTSRSASRFADDCKIDLVNTGQFAIQCKRSKKNWPSLNELLKIEHEKYANHIASSGIFGISTEGSLVMPDFVPTLQPMLITKIDNQRTIAAMYLDDLIPLISV